MSKIPVTVILLVSEDDPAIVGSLESLQRFQKIVVLDSSGIDDIGNTAKQHGAEHVSFTWDGKSSRKRAWYLDNHAIETDWVLFLDPEEVINDAFCDELQHAVDSGKYVGFWLTIHNRFMGKWLRHDCSASRLSLFRHDAGQYETLEDASWSNCDDEIHQQPVLDGPIGTIQTPVTHREHCGIDSYLARQNAFSTWEAHRFIDLSGKNRDEWSSLTRCEKIKYTFINQWWFSTACFIYMFVFKMGFLDGRSGLAFALLNRESYGHARLKILELRKKEFLESAPAPDSESASRSDVKKDVPVTLIVPVKNEARNLASCLDRVGRFQELVLVDSGSTDATIEIAESYGATCVQFSWNGRFPKKRNWYLDNHEIKTDWVLFLDADELINDAFCDEVRDAVCSGNHDGYWLTFHNWFQGKFLRHGDPFSKLALFRPDAGRYERVDDDQWSGLDMEIHEHPVLDGTVGQINSPIDHNDRRGLDSYINKHNEYSSWEARRHLAMVAQDDDSWQALTRRQQSKYKFIEKWWFKWAYFCLSFFVKLGFLDGRAGFVIASLKRQYYGHIRLKIREFRRMTKHQSNASSS